MALKDEWQVQTKLSPIGDLLSHKWDHGTQ